MISSRSQHELDDISLKANGGKSNWDLRVQYNELQNKVTKIIKQIKVEYFCNKIEENKHNPQQLWKIFIQSAIETKIKETLA